MTDIEQKGNFGVLCSEVPFLLRGIAVCPDAYIFCESSKRMDENEKNAGGNSGF